MLDEFMKGPLSSFDAMTLGEDIRLNTYIINGIRTGNNILQLFNPDTHTHT